MSPLVSAQLSGALLATDTIPAPTVNYGAVSPMLIVFGVAIAGVLVEAFLSRSARIALQPWLAGAGLVGAIVAVALVAADGTVLQTAGAENA